MRSSPIEGPAQGFAPSRPDPARNPVAWIMLGCVLLALPIKSRAGDCIDYQDYIHRVGGLTTVAAQSAAVAGNHAYVADTNNLLVLDITNPAASVLVGAAAINAVHVAVAGNYAYVACRTSGFKVVDISIPTAPVVVGSVDTPHIALSVAISGSHAYVADGIKLQVIDISNPFAPTIVGAANTPFSMDVEVVGNFAYVISHVDPNSFSTFQIFDISIPAAPSVRSSINVTNDVTRLAVANNHAYFSDEIGGMMSIDVSNPVSPLIRDTIETRMAFDVAVTGNRALLAIDSGLLVVDISNPASLEIVGTVPLPASSFDDPRGIGLSGDLAVVAHLDTGVHIVDIMSPVMPPLAGSMDSPGRAQRMVVNGTRGYLADLFGLIVMDLSNPVAPSLIGDFPTQGLTRDVLVIGNYALVADGTLLLVLDVSNPGNIALVTSIPTQGNATALMRHGNYVYVATGSPGLMVVDVSNPASPQHLLTIDTPGGALEVTVVGNVAYVADGNAGLRIFDVSSPASPAFVGAVDTPGTANDVAVVGGHAFIADGGVLRVANISNPGAPVLVGALDVPFGATGVTLDGPFAYVAGGLHVVGIGDPETPVILGTIFTPGQSVTVSDNLLYLIDEMNGVLVYPLQCNTTTAVDPGGEHTPGAGLLNLLSQNRPNPFHPGHGLTQIQFDMARQAHASLRLFDAAGRRVRLLFDETIAPGSHQVAWDGRNDSGQEVAAGVYFYRLDAGEFSATRRLVKLR